MKDFLQMVQDRRSIYAISSDSPISDERIEEILQLILKNEPSFFDAHSGRIVLFLGQSNKRLWQIVLDTLREVVPAENFTSTEKKIGMFAAGHGSILFFDDTTVTQEFAEKYPLYKESFPIWAQQQSGMLQYTIWAALEAEGMGVNLQHYNPLIDDAVKKEWNLPGTWELIAQMPFGAPTFMPAKKTKELSEPQLKVFGLDT